MFSFLYHRNTSYADRSPHHQQKFNGMVDTGRLFPALLATTPVRTSCEGAQRPTDPVTENTAPSQESDASVWKLPEGIEDLLADGESKHVLCRIETCIKKQGPFPNERAAQSTRHSHKPICDLCFSSERLEFEFFNSISFPLQCVVSMNHVSCYQSRFRHCSGRSGRDDIVS
jgi:hypothetical protein